MMSMWHRPWVGKVIFAGSLVVCVAIVFLLASRQVDGMDLPSEVLDLLVREWEILSAEMRAESGALNPGRIVAVQAWEEFNGYYFIIFRSTKGSGTAVFQTEDNHVKTLSVGGGTGTPQPGYGVSHMRGHHLGCAWIYGLPKAVQTIEVVFADAMIEHEVDGETNLIIV